MIEIMSGLLIAALAPLPWTDRHVAAGARVFHAGDAVRSMFIVAEGAARLVRRRPDGDALVLQIARAGEPFAEASLTAARYHCDGEAQGPTRLRQAPVDAVKTLFARDATAATAWIAHLGAQVQAARWRVELLGLRTVAGRLDAWLDWRGADLPPRGAWRSLAEELGVTPEALYRELARHR